MNDPATKARDSASHCEAKLHAFRKTQDGIVVAFVLHPNDVPASLQLAPLGTRYMLALVEIGEDEQPQPAKGSLGRSPTAHEHQTTTQMPAREVLPVSNTPPARALYADPRFWRFLGEAKDRIIDNAEDAAHYVRKYCDVASCDDIRPGTIAENRWNLLVSAYRAWDRAPSCGVA